ncbi:leukocyte cell-derived chemotaxin-2-like, partial [Falco biarmicus]|uniref:leukocyte cell-derived chemotaxin-2-like n=1 Tax=Falco biarmicus TaxID=345155 RepID=UPI0024BD0AB6
CTLTAVICEIAISSATAAQRAKICSSHPANKIRGCDSQGCSGCDDPRNKHEKTGRRRVSSWQGAQPRANPPCSSNSVQLSGSGFCVKMCYIKYSGPIKKGEKIDVLLPMQRVCKGITSPVCIQNCDLTDLLPTCKQEAAHQGQSLQTPLLYSLNLSGIGSHSSKVEATEAQTVVPPKKYP